MKNQATEKPVALKLEKVTRRIPAQNGGFELSADFTVAPGERAALLGRSGSGKTTLLRIVAGLEALESGRITLGDQEISALPARDRGIGVIFQEQALFPALDVLDNVTFGLRMRGVSRDERDAAAMPWLDRVGLKSHVHAPVSQLSGGERQRVAFVRALIWKPRLLLLDEPFSALDPTLRSSLRQELVSLHALWPVPLMMVTHDDADIEQVATTRLVFSEPIPGHRKVLSETH
jgi:ABC-type Fe3+/spermidine/putrescine transport system ATPase subunit